MCVPGTESRILTEANAQQMKGKHGELNEGVGLGKAHIIWGLSANAKEFAFYANCQGEM